MTWSRYQGICSKIKIQYTHLYLNYSIDIIQLFIFVAERLRANCAKSSRVFCSLCLQIVLSRHANPCVIISVGFPDFHATTRPHAFISFSLFGNTAEKQFLIFDTDYLSVIQL